MLGDSIVVQNMACCPHLCEVFQQNLNTSKQMFPKKKKTFLKCNVHRFGCIFVTKVKQIDVLNKEDNILNLTREVIKSISLKCQPLFLVFAHKSCGESPYPLFSTGKIKSNFASDNMKRGSTSGNMKVASVFENCVSCTENYGCDFSIWEVIWGHSQMHSVLHSWNDFLCFRLQFTIQDMLIASLFRSAKPIL